MQFRSPSQPDRHLTEGVVHSSLDASDREVRPASPSKKWPDSVRQTVLGKRAVHHGGRTKTCI
jgi:hypothetical protein